MPSHTFDKNKFAKKPYYEHVKVVITYISSLIARMTIYLANKVYIILLLVKIIIILVKYLDLADVFLKTLAKMLSKRIRVNKYVIELEKRKQPPYKIFNILGPVKLKIFKIYSKIKLANSFLKLLKATASNLILFNQKLDGSLFLYINY